MFGHDQVIRETTVGGVGNIYWLAVAMIDIVTDTRHVIIINSSFKGKSGFSHLVYNADHFKVDRQRTKTDQQ